jgi:hypothetical protein
MSTGLQRDLLSEPIAEARRMFLETHKLTERIVGGKSQLLAARPGSTDALYGFLLERIAKGWTPIDDCAFVLYGSRIEKNIRSTRSRVRAVRQSLLTRGALLLVDYAGESLPGSKRLGRIARLKLFNQDSPDDRSFVRGYLSALEDSHECGRDLIHKMRDLAGLEQNDSGQE